MGKDTSNNCYKNAICISVGLLIIFTTSIFVAKDYYGLHIAQLIDEASILKDYRFSDWGKHPGNIQADYTYTFTFDDHGANKASDPITFNHSFTLADVTFGQGNQGSIKYLHQWDLTPSGALPDTPLTTINLAAQKVYAYERLAPDARRFATLYNTLWRTAEQQLLPFYAKQLYGFYFQHKQTVFDAVFTEAGIAGEKMEQIYGDAVYGWGSSQALQVWVLLAHQKNRKELREYELVQQTLGLTAAEVDRLVGEHSMLNSLSSALNGTIRLILENARTYNYDKCQPFCSNNQLVAFQMLSGALTNNPVFVNVNLKSSLKGLNASLPDEVEFNRFCPDAFQCPLDDNSLKFFVSGHLGNFSTMSKVFSNIDSVQIVQSLFQLPDASSATNILSYMKYLQQKIFTPTNPTSQLLDRQAYDYMLNNHLFINSAINSFKNILNIELHTRALYQLVKDAKNTCENFFQGNYKDFEGLCKKTQFDLTQMPAIRTYVKAYFFINRNDFAKETGMTMEQASQFLRLDAQSLFASKMKEIRTTIATSLGCNNGACTEEDLLVMQWSGQQDVLSRLPPALFPTPPASIIEWDIDNKLNGVQPQYHKIIGEKISQEQGKTLLGSGPESILVLFNLLSLKTSCDTGDATAKKYMNYVQKVVIDIFFGGPTTTKPLSQLVAGVESTGIRVKQEGESLLGGAPWLGSKVRVMETSHRPNSYSKLNTGIYDHSSIRKMMEVDHSAFLGSQLTVFSSEYEEVTEFLSSGRSVYGTNLLGFHSDLSSSQSLAVLLDFAYQGVILSPQSSAVNYQGIDAIQYSLGSVPKVSIGFNEQNERVLSLNKDSYFTVDPVTGNTLVMRVKFTVSSPASFLKYYPGASTEEKVLFNCEVSYSRRDVSALLEIADAKGGLRNVYILTIVLASLSMISVAVLAVVSRLKGRKKGERELSNTLLASDSSVVSES